ITSPPQNANEQILPILALLKSLKQLLQEDFQRPEELLGADADSLEAVFGAPEVGPWEEDEPSNSALVEKENAQLLKDLVRTSKRSWSRYKKGGMHSCFGVRLERIGSFSGLGC
uniref:Natriuretic peptide A-like n=1 Tax=Neogobius melanostomus TaxID=47308 RepID=A0A8C6WYS8_9GOBI